MANPFFFAVMLGLGLSLTIYYYLRDGREVHSQGYPTSDREPNNLYRSSECTICQDQLRHNSRLLKCGHSFHATCIEKWFQVNVAAPTCPNCRKSV